MGSRPLLTVLPARNTVARNSASIEANKHRSKQMSTSDFPRNPEGMPEGIIDMPADIQSRTFAIVRRGYDRAEVDAFMKRLAETISELLEERTVLSADATTALDSESIAESTAILEDAEERASRRLHAATLEADRLRTEARRTLEKATKEAQEMENTSRANAEQITNKSSKHTLSLIHI